MEPRGTRLELTWPGKDQFLLVPRDDSGKPVWVERDHPAASEVRLSRFTAECGETDPSNPYTDNLLFTGDSLDVLRILAESPEYRREYRGKVKLCYIDPPFNTGQAFEHYDDWMEHSTWLSFMRDRLLLIKELLAPNGSIWVHLDDAEQHRVRCLMDEIFGAQNFVSSTVWQRRHSRSNDALVSVSHDYLLAYARDKSAYAEARNRIVLDPEEAPDYSNPDDDPRGPWRSISFTAPNLRPNLSYEITAPSGKVHRPPAGRCWRTTESEFEKLLADNRIYFGRKGQGVPRVKQFLSDAPGLVPNTWWPHAEVGHNDEGKKEIQALFPGVAPFATPKPERLLSRIVHIASDPGEIVFDCFVGSGTLAAVAHKMGRRWVAAEISSATVESFTRTRLEMVVRGEDEGGISETVQWAGGGGFRSAEVSPSMYEVTPFGVMLADWATNGDFARAVAGQLGFDWQPNATPFCGARGRMRLSVFDGAVGQEEIRQTVAALADKERVTVVAKMVLPGAEETLTELARGSRIRKAPRDLLSTAARRARRRNEAADEAGKVQ